MAGSRAETPLVLILVLRRALVQRRLLVAVVALVATACTLVGTCTLLLGATQHRAFDQEIQHSQPDDVSVTAFLVEIAGSDITSTGDEARTVVESVLGSMRPKLETTTTSRLRDLGSTSGSTRADPGARAYLTATNDLVGRADLTAGRWVSSADDVGSVTSPYAAVVPDTTARLLGLALGDEVTLGDESGIGGVDGEVRLVVVGTFRPRSDVEWERDPLAGAGFSAAYSDGLEAAPTYGPFVITDDAFQDSGSSARGLRVTGHPTLDLAGDSALRAAAGSLDDASGLLAARVGDRARVTRLASELPRSLDRIQAQQASTRSTILVVLLLGTALSLAAALLAGRLVASTRDDERDLLATLGLSRRQQLLGAAVEALLLSVVAAVLAAPAAALLHSRLTHRADLAAAGLAQGPSVTPGLVLAVLAAAILLAAALMSTTVRARRVTDALVRGGSVVRHAPGLLLAASAALAWWQLHSRPDATSGAGDVVLTLAPVLCLMALTVLGVRVVPVLLAWAAILAARSRALVVPLAAQQAARRPDTGVAMVLVAAAVAAAVFGLALDSTWERSQDDQAALRVGTDLALALPSPAGFEEAADFEAALADQSPAPAASLVIHRPLALGRYVGEEGARPVLVATDAVQSGALLRGRLDGTRTWAEVGAELAPDTSDIGVPMPDDGAGLQLRGQAPPGTSLVANVTAVLEDSSGLRTSVPVAPVPLDGTGHPVRWLGALRPDLRLVAMQVDLDGSAGPEPSASATIRIDLTVPDAGSAPDDDRAWEVSPVQEQGAVAASAIDLRSRDDALELRTTLTVNLDYFQYSGADVLATGFAVPDDIPVAVSQELVDAVGASVGDRLSAIVGDTALALRVAAVVPTVPSAPGEVAVLADSDTLSRALIGAGQLAPVVDGWWVADPDAETTRALRSSQLGEVTTRDDVATQLAQGPLRVSVPTTLLTLVVLAVTMLLAAVVLVLGADGRLRSAEVVRLRALGVSPRDVRRLQLVEHLALLVPLIVVGVVVGVLATLLVGTQLVRSDLGAAPVPRAVVAWPWTAELLLVGGLLVGTLVVTATLTALLVRRSGHDRLRAGGW